MGLLGILDEAARRGQLDFSDALDRLIETDFYLSAKLLAAFRQLNEK